MSISAGCLPLQIPECQSLGHTSVMLPNVFGHNSLEQATTYFKVFKNESCSASALYYTCNMLFPKCDPVTMQPIYACQNHCLGMKKKNNTVNQVLCYMYIHEQPQIIEIKHFLKKIQNTMYLLAKIYLLESVLERQFVNEK